MVWSLCRYWVPTNGEDVSAHIGDGIRLLVVHIQAVLGKELFEDIDHLLDMFGPQT